MQVFTYMVDTGQRILEAATRIFARDGVSGATTREIARLAKVNEVTLFRYFKNKNELLRQVILQKCRKYEHVFAEAPFATADDLRRTVEAYARIHVRILRENEDFIRTFYGELNRHPKLCRRLFVESAKQVRHKFIDYLRAARRRGLVRRNLDVVTGADALTGMLMSGVMRRPLTEPEYTNERFSRDAVELFLRGIQK
jgi:AcrR family transcriptional regulator